MTARKLDGYIDPKQFDSLVEGRTMILKEEIIGLNRKQVKAELNLRGWTWRPYGYKKIANELIVEYREPVRGISTSLIANVIAHHSEWNEVMSFQELKQALQLHVSRIETNAAMAELGYKFDRRTACWYKERKNMAGKALGARKRKLIGVNLDPKTIEIVKVRSEGNNSKFIEKCILEYVAREGEHESK